jgi:hypothetical protein
MPCYVDLINIADVNPYSRPAEVEDTLPPFSTLTTDEERERKAETRGPGQYFVLANLGSFASLPEYRDESLADLEKVVSFESADYDTDSGSRVLDSGDPDVVILKNFEDPVRRAHGSAPQQLTVSPSTIFFKAWILMMAENGVYYSEWRLD